MDLKSIYESERRKCTRLTVAFSAVMFIAVLVSVSLGAARIPVRETASIIAANIMHPGLISGSGNCAIVWDVRLPRVLTGIVVGAGLAVSGSIFQSILRNPLADPYTIGVSTGAAFGAVLAIYLNLVFGLGVIPVMPVSFAFAVGTLLLITKIAGREGMLSPSRLVLSGIIVSAVLSSGISLIKSMAGEDVGAIVFWLMGSLAAKSWLQFLTLFPVVSLCIAAAVHFADDLDVLSLGALEAKNVGVRADSRIRMYLILASLVTAACVSTSGIIGFVGLVVPHILRMGVSAKHRYLIPLSALAGGTMLCVADNLSRLLFAVEIPVGVVTTLVGGPFFIYLFMDKKSKGGFM